MDRTEYIRTVETYANDIYRVAFCYCRNKSDAEDIIQSVFLKLLQTEQEFQDDRPHRYNEDLFKLFFCENGNTDAI